MRKKEGKEKTNKQLFFFFQKLLKAEAYRWVRMYNLQSAKRLCLGRNLTGDSTCPSTRDGGKKRILQLQGPFYRISNWVHGPITWIFISGVFFIRGWIALIEKDHIHWLNGQGNDLLYGNLLKIALTILLVLCKRKLTCVTNQNSTLFICKTYIGVYNRKKTLVLVLVLYSKKKNWYIQSMKKKLNA